MKKCIAIMLTIVLISSLLLMVACNTPSLTDDVITIWHDKEDSVIAVLEELLEPLTEQFEIVFVRKDGLTESLKLVGNDVNSAPDMYLFAHDKVGLFSELGILEPITTFIPLDELESDYVDTTISAATYNGEVYQLPIYFETLLFMYNKDLMSEDEVPTTTEELYQYMVDNTNKNTREYGFVEQHSTPYYSIPWIHGFGGNVLDDEGNPSLYTEEVMASLEYHLKFLDYMPGESAYSTINTLFTEGMAHSIIGGPWLVPTIRENGINLGFAAMPIVDSTGLSLSPYLGVQGVHVLKCAAQDQENIDRITLVLQALANAEVGGQLAQVSGCAPARLDSYELDYVIEDEMVTAMRDTALCATPIPNVPEMDVMFTIMGFLLSDVNLNGKDIEESVIARQAKAEELIALMG